jgi:hypothetical protein
MPQITINVPSFRFGKKDHEPEQPVETETIELDETGEFKKLSIERAIGITTDIRRAALDFGFPSSSDRIADTTYGILSIRSEYNSAFVEMYDASIDRLRSFYHLVQPKLVAGFDVQLIEVQRTVTQVELGFPAAPINPVPAYLEVEA